MQLRYLDEYSKMKVGRKGFLLNAETLIKDRNWEEKVFDLMQTRSLQRYYAERLTKDSMRVKNDCIDEKNRKKNRNLLYTQQDDLDSKTIPTPQVHRSNKQMLQLIAFEGVNGEIYINLCST